MKTLAYFLPLIIVLQTLTGCALLPSGKQDEEQAVKQIKEQVAVVTTEKGTFVIEFYPESAPVAVENFKKLINQKFYDGLTFHRIINAPGLNIVQGGCPNGDGMGDPGWNIVDEYTNPNQRKHLRGTVAMARANVPNSSGSQFYVCLKPQPHLDRQYTTFGGVIQGMTVVDFLEMGDVITTIRLEAKANYDEANKN
jgi:cyclophilin family peptidyl-prolyl cis-trans isomerase